MDGALVASAFLMGLAGSPHCAAMCGAPCGAIAGMPRAGHWPARLIALHAGRLASYSVAGAVVAASVASLAGWSHNRVVQPLWVMAHVAAIAFGLWLLWKARAPAWLAGTPARFASLTSSAWPSSPLSMAGARPMRLFLRLPPAGRAGLAGLAGLLWASMPCGLLQSALVVAALASGPLAGAAVMAAFALASAVGLWLGPRLWQALRGSDRRALTGTMPVRLAGALLAASSLFAVWHGLAAAIDRALCAVVA